jgi:MFS family permease
MTRLQRLTEVFGSVFRNRDLRRLELGFAAFNAAEWGTWIAMLVYAYRHGGAMTAGLVAVVQLVPAAVLSPVTASFADRRRPAAVLRAGYVVQAAAIGATAAALLLGLPPFVVYALAAVAVTTITVTRPTQAALVPSLAHSPEEVTATTVLSGWIESVAVLAAPAVTGGLLAVGSPGLVFAVMAGCALAAALAVLRIVGPHPVARLSTGPLDDAVHAARLVARTPGAPLLVGVVGSQYVLIGALDVLFVVLAIGVLDLGGSGAGYLNAAFGAGGVVGIVATSLLVGRRRLAPPLALGGAVFSFALILIGLVPTAAATAALLVAAGVGRTLLDIAGRALLLRTAPPVVAARAFGLLEGAAMGGLALGSLLVPAIVELSGPRTTCVVLGCLLPLGALVVGRRLLAADASATVPVVEIGLLRSLPLFAPLAPCELEALAMRLEPLEVGTGVPVVRTGERGDRFYLVAHGTLEVRVDGRPVRRLAHGDGFGEIALLRNVPRTADVVALEPSRLYALCKPDFIAALAMHPSAAREREQLLDAHVGAELVA